MQADQGVERGPAAEREEGEPGICGRFPVLTSSRDQARGLRACGAETKIWQWEPAAK